MKILDKSSASPSMLIYLEANENLFYPQHQEETIIKLFVQPSHVFLQFLERYQYTPRKKADIVAKLSTLIYEGDTYNYLYEKQTEFVMKRIATAHIKIDQLLERIKDEDKAYLCSSLCMYLRTLTEKEVVYNRAELESAYLIEGNKERYDLELSSLSFNLIILPYIRGFTYLDVIKGNIFNDILMCFAKILIGIKHLYDNHVVHQDLHFCNILIHENKRDLFIFDFDRCFCNNTPNPLLNSEPNKSFCQFSQCNVFNDTHVIDFYYVLARLTQSSHFTTIFSALVSDRDEFYMIDNEFVFYMDDEQRTEINVRNFLFTAISKYFSNRGVEQAPNQNSYLQFYDNNPMFKRFVSITTPFDRVYVNFFREYSIYLRERRPQARFGFSPVSNRIVIHNSPINQGVSNEIDFLDENDLDENDLNLSLIGNYETKPLPELIDEIEQNKIY